YELSMAQVARVLAAVVALASAAATSNGLAQPKGAGGDGDEHGKSARGGGDEIEAGEARDHFLAAIKLSKAGNFVAALEEFQLAYDKNPSYKLLFNIGQLAKYVHQDVRSMRAFERYLAEGGSEIGKARRAEVESALSELRQTVGTLEIKIPKG